MTYKRAPVDWCWDVCAPEHRSVARRLDAIGWGAFFIWIGAALLADLGWGITLVGIGLITLGGQAARWLYRLRLEGFWLLVGAGFLLGGLWQLAEVTLPLLPVLLVLAGLVLVFTALSPRRRTDRP